MTGNSKRFSLEAQLFLSIVSVSAVLLLLTLGLTLYYDIDRQN